MSAIKSILDLVGNKSSSVKSVRKNINNKTIVTIEEAKTLQVFKSSLDLVSNSIGSTDITLIKVNTQDGSERTVYGDSRLNLINKQPNKTSTGFNLKKMLVSDLLCYGVALTYITRDEVDGVTPIGLSYLSATSCSFELVSYNGVTLDEIKIYYTNFNGEQVSIPEEDVIIFSLEGENPTEAKGILGYAGKTVSLGLTQRDFENELMLNGNLSNTVWKVDNRSDAVFDDLENVVMSNYNSGRTRPIVTTSDVKVETIGQDQTKVIDSIKKNTMNDIANAFGVPVELLSASESKGNSNDVLNLYMKVALLPIYEVISQGLNIALLTEEEKREGYEFRFDTQKYMNMGIARNPDDVINLWNSGLIDNIQASRLVGLNNVGKKYSKYTTGSVLWDKDDDILINPNMNKENQLINVGELINSDINKKEEVGSDDEK